MTNLHFTIPAMTCGHCVDAVRAEISKLPGVAEVDVDLSSKEVVVRGNGVDDEAVWAAVDEAGYEAVR